MNRVGDLAMKVVLHADPQRSQVWQLVPGSIYDGDTLRVQRDGTEMKVRLCGIDAPEKDQPMGLAARDHLRSLIDQGDGSIIIVPVEQDRYGRTVAELFVQPRPGQGYRPGEEIGVNSQMVLEGYAYHYAQYSDNCPNGGAIAQAEAIAREERLGVWVNPGAMKPWDYRRFQP